MQISLLVKDLADLPLPNTNPWQSQIQILTMEMFLTQVIIRKDITPEPEVSKQRIKNKLNVIGCISCLPPASMLLVIGALGYFSSCPSAKMATCHLVLYLDSCLWPWLPDHDRQLQIHRSVRAFLAQSSLRATDLIRHDAHLLNVICQTT